MPDLIGVHGERIQVTVPPAIAQGEAAAPAGGRIYAEPPAAATGDRTGNGVKKWLRTPIFGPMRAVCYECGAAHWVGYFAFVDLCGCGSRRFHLE